METNELAFIVAGTALFVFFMILRHISIKQHKHSHNKKKHA